MSVVVVGGGGAGLTASMLFARMGVDSLLVSSLPTTSTQPKAHVLNQRAMEIMRDCGVDEAIYAIGTPPVAMSHTAYYAGFAGHPGAGRLIHKQESWGGGGADADWAAASPMVASNLPQIRLEPVLRARAEQLSPGRVRFHHEVVEIDESESSVSLTVVDRSTDRRYLVETDYVVACDGGRTVGAKVGIELEGQRDLSRTVSFYVTADLSRWARDHDVLLRWHWCPNIGKMVVIAPMGPTRWGPESEEWVIHIGFPMDDSRALDDAAVESDVREALGIGDHPLDIHLISRWTIGGLVANRFRSGRVFVAGDAAHRHPPTGALGLTSAMHDVQNLCWKLAYRIRGVAGDGLLDTYEPERKPVDVRNVRRSLDNSRAHSRLAAPLGFADPTATADDRWASLGRLFDDRPENLDLRRRVHEMMAAQSQEFHEHDVEYGYTHVSSAVVPDGSAPEAEHDFRFFVPSTRPGSPLPHAWIEDWNFERQSTLDLVAVDRFVLVAGEDGEAWCEAARTLAPELGIALDAHRIGHSRGDFRDPRLRWERVRGFGPDGAILVRPDRCVAYRSVGAVDDPTVELRRVMRSILSL